MTSLPFGQRFALGLWSFHIEVLSFLLFHIVCFFFFLFGGLCMHHWQTMSIVSSEKFNLRHLVLELKILDIINVAPSYS
jgi:hypothetical protein